MVLHLYSMEQEDIDRQMNELDALLQAIDNLPLREEPAIQRIDPLPQGVPGTVLTNTGNNTVWTTAASTITPSYETWITPGQINPTTDSPYRILGNRSDYLDDILGGWLKSSPAIKTYNFFTSLTLIKDPNDKVELSKRLRERQARKKSRDYNNGDSEVSNSGV